jgi:hypothetical protein
MVRLVAANYEINDRCNTVAPMPDSNDPLLFLLPHIMPQILADASHMTDKPDASQTRTRLYYGV